MFCAPPPHLIFRLLTTMPFPDKENTHGYSLIVINQNYRPNIGGKGRADRFLYIRFRSQRSVFSNLFPLYSGDREHLFFKQNIFRACHETKNLSLILRVLAKKPSPPPVSLQPQPTLFLPLAWRRREGAQLVSWLVWPRQAV